MTDPIAIGLIAATALIGLVIIGALALKGWQGWLDVRKLELASYRDDLPMPATGNRIEMADLKERIRKLEAIAAGIDL